LILLLLSTGFHGFLGRKGYRTILAQEPAATDFAACHARAPQPWASSAVVLFSLIQQSVFLLFVTRSFLSFCERLFVCRGFFARASLDLVLGPRTPPVLLRFFSVSAALCSLPNRVLLYLEQLAVDLCARVRDFCGPRPSNP